MGRFVTGDHSKRRKLGNGGWTLAWISTRQQEASATKRVGSIVSKIFLGFLTLLSTARASGQDLVPAPSEQEDVRPRENRAASPAPSLANELFALPREAFRPLPEYDLFRGAEGVPMPPPHPDSFGSAKPAEARVDEILAQAESMLEQGSFDQALERFNTAILGDSNSTRAYIGRASVFIQQAQYIKVAGDTDVVTRESDHSETIWRRTYCELKSGPDGNAAHLDAALADLARILKREPLNVRARALRGLVLATKKEFDRAIEDLTYAIERENDGSRLRWADTIRVEGRDGRCKGWTFTVEG
jgi:tetratricopeptide (TPR) repeat protein